MVKRAAVVAKLGIKAHAHMLRHACGFKLANDGIDTRSLQAYLGHSNIQNTARCVGVGSVQEFLAGLAPEPCKHTKRPTTTHQLREMG